MVSQKITHHVFTKKSDGIARELVTEAVLRDPISKSHIRLKRVVWDTGATNSAINESVAKNLGLVPTGKTSVTTSNGTSIVNTYVVEVVLPNQVMVHNLMVSEGKLGSVTEMLIGMDVIAHGDLTVQNVRGKTEFSFCFPAFETKYDMLEKAAIINKANMINS